MQLQHDEVWRMQAQAQAQAQQQPPPRSAAGCVGGLQPISADEQRLQGGNGMAELRPDEAEQMRHRQSLFEQQQHHQHHQQTAAAQAQAQAQAAAQPVQQPAALQQVQVEAVPAGGVRIGAAAPPPEDLVDSGMDEMD